MPGTSPGWPGLGPSSLVMLVTLATTAVTLSDLSDDNKTIVRLDIGSVDQPANCSGFLDDLEVRWFLKIVHFLLKMWYSIMDDIEFSIWKLEMLCFPTTCENSWKWSPSRRCSADDDANLITAGVKSWSTLQKYWLTRAVRRLIPRSLKPSVSYGLCVVDSGQSSHVNLLCANCAALA